MTFSTYSTGTVSVSAGGARVTGPRTGSELQRAMVVAGRRDASIANLPSNASARADLARLLPQALLDAEAIAKSDNEEHRRNGEGLVVYYSEFYASIIEENR